ncbi:MAG: helix-turn-helix domain-containing protein [Prevotella sp.]|uniref:helix-turn-helix domain-containing protein n=1 Tax=Prevotella sp. TaxID=59823 RepID=UPI002A32BEF3|nr:helix-turn-helix domain-containing protein [Prevotella sp.]MDD7318408.1 helix-turn-helix domain-containing protein [Prevotellaceae bacterium]MDY4020241.1 helix-turn-helix domain-containing protein [Prevotella sp.]
MYNHLTREQRYAIYPGLQRKDSISAIARQIGVSPAVSISKCKITKLFLLSCLLAS